MPPPDPDAARQFALSVVQQLREAGFQALWAGGCVRDRLMGRVPKDYDVATAATPDQVRTVIGRRRTLAIGAVFGVVTVLGPRSAGQVEVATFRKDATYSDGRHPDHVTFTDAQEDALRRDFTINGLFWDPVEECVIDYVDGQADLAAGIVRAIGDAHHRIAEDKLRMLRAVRFASFFGFRVDPSTLTAIAQHAAEISVVSVERISEELRRMLLHASRRKAVELLQQTGLLGEVLPELREATARRSAAQEPLGKTFKILGALQEPTFAASFAALIRDVAPTADLKPARDICRRCKLSNTETRSVLFCLEHERLIRNALDESWADLQPVLVDPNSEELLGYVAAVVEILDSSSNAVEFCRQQLAMPPDRLNPAPLLTGDDLRAAGMPTGPAYRAVLKAVRDAQLLNQVVDRQSALVLAKQLWADIS